LFNVSQLEVTVPKEAKSEPARHSSLSTFKEYSKPMGIQLHSHRCSNPKLSSKWWAFEGSTKKHGLAPKASEQPSIVKLSLPVKLFNLDQFEAPEELAKTAKYRKRFEGEIPPPKDNRSFNKPQQRQGSQNGGEAWSGNGQQKHNSQNATTWSGGDRQRNFGGGGGNNGGFQGNRDNRGHGQQGGFNRDRNFSGHQGHRHAQPNPGQQGHRWGSPAAEPQQPVKATPNAPVKPTDEEAALQAELDAVRREISTLASADVRSTPVSTPGKQSRFDTNRARPSASMTAPAAAKGTVDTSM
jgi:hypothetical protein